MHRRGTAGRVATTIGLSLACLAFGAGSAAAAIRTVPTAAYPTIQSAVDAAAPGDTVQVKKGGGLGTNGEYRENVVIDKGIRLLCLNSAVIDVSGLVTQRGGADYANGVSVVGPGGDGAWVEGCKVKFARACSSATNPACPLNDSPGAGISGNADRVVVRNCRLVQNSVGVSLTGDLLAVIATQGIGNTAGIAVTSDHYFVSGNRVRGGSTGIMVRGGGVLRGNKASVMIGTGIVLTGPTCGPATANVVSATLIGMLVNCTAAGSEIRNNAAADNSAFGLQVVATSNATIAWNSSRRNFMAGIAVSQGANLSIFENVAQGNFGDGILVDGVGDNVGLRGNLVKGNAGDGINVNRPAATAILIAGNRVFNNEGTGIENDALLTTITANRAFGNRTDIAGAGGAGAGTVGVFGGNLFGTGGAGVSTPGTGRD